MSISMGQTHMIGFTVNATDLAAGTSQFVSSPADGWIVGLQVTPTVAISTGGTITVKADGDNDGTTTTVAGLTCTVPDSATKGHAAYIDDVPTANSATQKVKRGDLIEVVVDAAFNGGGALHGFVVLQTGSGR